MAIKCFTYVPSQFRFETITENCGGKMCMNKEHIAQIWRYIFKNMFMVKCVKSVKAKTKQTSRMTKGREPVLGLYQ